MGNRRFCLLTPDGKLVIGFSGKYEIEVYDVDKGKLFSFKHKHLPVKVTNQDQKKWFDGITFSGPGGVSQGAPDFMKKNTEFPKFKPAFNQIMVDSQGNILVCTYQKQKADDFKFFDAFDPEGNFIKNVQILGDGKFPIMGARMRNNSFWVPTSDKDELIQIFKYRISK